VVFLVSCLMKVIHIQRHIPLVRGTVSSVISGHGELNSRRLFCYWQGLQKRDCLQPKEAMHFRGNAPLQRPAETILQPFGCLLSRSQLETSPKLGLHQKGGSSCYRVIKVRQSTEGPADCCESQPGSGRTRDQHRPLKYT
jgi:hypothetical protein